MNRSTESEPLRLFACLLHRFWLKIPQQLLLFSIAHNWSAPLSFILKTSTSDHPPHLFINERAAKKKSFLLIETSSSSWFGFTSNRPSRNQYGRFLCSDLSPRRGSGFEWVVSFVWVPTWFACFSRERKTFRSGGQKASSRNNRTSNPVYVDISNKILSISSSYLLQKYPLLQFASATWYRIDSSISYHISYQWFSISSCHTMYQLYDTIR